MATFCFNIAKGRVCEFTQNVVNNTPSGCALLVVAIKASAEPSQAVEQDVDTLSALFSAGATEASNPGYSRKVLVAADLATYNHAPDDSTNINWVDIPDPVWASVAAAGGAWGSIVICYRPGAGSADSAIVPLTHHTFSITPDGAQITAQVATTGFYSAA